MDDAKSETGALVTGLQVVAIYVTDLERALEFYEGLLGFKESGKMPPGRVLSAAGITLYIEPGRAQRSPIAEQACGVAPAFAAESVLAARDKLIAAGVPMHGELVHPGDEFAFFQCLDPDGNIIEFAGRP